MHTTVPGDIRSPRLGGEPLDTDDLERTPLYGDFDGDSRDDAASWLVGSGCSSINVRLTARPTGPLPVTPTAGCGPTRYVTDVNGDRFDDLLVMAADGTQRVHAGRREAKWMGGAVPNFVRRPYGPGWALVGDAGYHKDPCTAQGITDAFRDAELLADAIDAGMAEREPLEHALTGYERQRNEAALPMYEFTCQLAPSTHRHLTCNTCSSRSAPTSNRPAGSSASSPDPYQSRTSSRRQPGNDHHRSTTQLTAKTQHSCRCRSSAACCDI